MTVHAISPEAEQTFILCFGKFIIASLLHFTKLCIIMYVIRNCHG